LTPRTTVRNARDAERITVRQSSRRLTEIGRQPAEACRALELPDHWVARIGRPIQPVGQSAGGGRMPNLYCGSDGYLT